MGANTTKTAARRAIPDNLAPGFKSYCVLLPDDNQYLQVFGTILDELTRYTAWDKSSGPVARRAVQDVWKTVQAAFPISEECGMPCLKFRNKPSSPCIVQISCDDGLTWSDAWNNSLCLPEAPLYQYTENWSLLVSYNGGVTYISGDNIDIRFNSPVLAPQIGVNAACRAAENIAQLVTNFRDSVYTALVAGGGLLVIVGAVGMLSLFIGTGGAVAPLLSAISAAIAELDASLWLEVVSDAAIDEFKCMVYCSLLDRPAGHQGEFNKDVYDAIQNRITAAFGSSRRLIFQLIVAIEGAAGLQNIAASGQGDGTSCTDCADCSCPDFTPSFDGASGVAYLGDCTWRFTLPVQTAEVVVSCAEGNFRLLSRTYSNYQYTEQYTLNGSGRFQPSDILAVTAMTEYIAIAARDFPIEITIKIGAAV